MSLALGGQAYEIPAAALPYLGRGLAPGLFDVGKLRDAGDGGRLLVRMSYHGRLSVLPGVTVTGSGGGIAEGYLTAASARVFGAALDSQFAFDHRRGSYGADGMFSDGLSIGLASAPAPMRTAGLTATAHAGSGTRLPDHPMKTLTVSATNLAGEPDSGDSVIVVNADDSSLFSGSGVFASGTAQFSVPSGHYWAVGEFTGPAGTGPLQTSVSRLAVVPQFSVTADTTVTIAERSASSKISMVTPRPARAVSTNFWLLRSGHSGPPVVLGWSDQGSPMRVTPATRRPTVGGLRAYASQELVSQACQRGTPYAYALSYTDPAGIIPAQRYRVRAASLATVSESYYQAVKSGGIWAIAGSFPHAGGSFLGYVEPYPYPLGLPRHQTVYVGGTGSSSMDWWSYYQASSAAEPYEGWQDDGTFRAYPAGRHLTEAWNAYPLHPGPAVNLAPASDVNVLLPAADRAGDTLTLDITPFSDNQSGHLGTGYSTLSGSRTAGTYQIDQNGRKIAGGDAVRLARGGNGGKSYTLFHTHVHLSRRPSTIRFTLNATRTGPEFPLSTASSTTWTWRSAREPGGRLPEGWYCSYSGPISTRCAVQPLMTLRYAVAGMALNGSVRPGRQVIDLTVGHLQAARAARISGARASVSFNDGKTWHAVQVTRRGTGKFRAVFTAPPRVKVTMRVIAADTAGGRIDETIKRGYEIASDL